MKTPFDIIVAVDKNFGIGKDGKLPWQISGDMQHFKKVTTHTEDKNKKNAVIMGRKTWESLPEKFRPLPQRLNVVLTRKTSTKCPQGVLMFNDLRDALTAIVEDKGKSVEKIFVIGGSEIFKQAIVHPDCQKLIVTFISEDFRCDVFFPSELSGFTKDSESDDMIENGVSYRFVEFCNR